MEENKDLTFEYEVTKTSKVFAKIFMYGSLLVTLFLVFVGFYFLFIDVIIGLSIYIFVIAFIFLGLTMFIKKYTGGMEEYKIVSTFKDDGIYYLYDNKTEDIKLEFDFPYDDVQALYLARGYQLWNHDSNPLTRYLVYPIIIVEWKHDGIIDYFSQGLDDKKLIEVLEKVPSSIPLYGLEYDFTYIPPVYFSKIIESSKLIEISREKPVEFPFQVYSVVHDKAPQWVPPEVKKTREENAKKSEHLKNAALVLIVVTMLFFSFWIMPNWTLLPDDTFSISQTMWLDIFYMIILLVLFIRYAYLYKKIFPIQKALKYALIIGGAEFVGGLCATLILDVPEGYLDAIGVQVFMTIILIAVLYFVYLFGELMKTFGKVIFSR